MALPGGARRRGLFEQLLDFGIGRIGLVEVDHLGLEVLVRLPGEIRAARQLVKVQAVDGLAPGVGPGEKRLAAGAGKKTMPTLTPPLSRTAVAGLSPRTVKPVGRDASALLR